jgi:hypothetical protein
MTEQSGRRRDAVHTAAPEGRPRRLDGGDVVEQMETGVVERSRRGGERRGRCCQESAGGEISPGGKRRVGVNLPRRMGSQTPIYFDPGTNRDAGVQPREISGNPLADWAFQRGPKGERCTVKKRKKGGSKRKNQ